jgi:ribosomal protein S18 acetylase RimI-like enzyme
VLQLRRIRADDGLRYRDVRLRGLANTPSAFQTRYEDAATRPDGYWHDVAAGSERGDERVQFVADDGERFQASGGGLIDDGGTVVEVIGIWVDPAHRGQGIGEALVREAMAWGQQRGASSARLWVNVENHTAIRLYERLGFARTDRTQAFGECGERTRMMMARDLDGSPS